MISAVVLTYNSRDSIKPCLDSLFGQATMDLEVIVVDNGSVDGTANLIKDGYPKAVLIENEKNFGACYARNQGIRASKGDWILSLDCDVVLEQGFLSYSVEMLGELSPRIGVLQPKILDHDREKIYSCGIALSPLRRFCDIGNRRKDAECFNHPKEVFGATSCAAFYKRECLEDVKDENGYFDERFFFLVEDVDLAWRAQKKGWKALYYPKAICCHHGNSSGAGREKRQYLSFRNRYMMISKNEALKGKVVLLIMGFWYELLRFTYIALTNRYLYAGYEGAKSR